MTEEVREAILEILSMSWEGHGIGHNGSSASKWRSSCGHVEKNKNRFTRSGRVIREAPLSQPARTRRSRSPVSSFPWSVSKEGTKSPEPGFCVRRDSGDDSGKSEAIIPLGSPMNGHLVIHASMVPRAPLETNQEGIIKTMFEAIFEILVKEPGVLGGGRGDQFPQKQKHASGRSPDSLVLLQESPQHNVISLRV